MDKLYRSIIRYGFYAGCYLVLIGAVLLPFVTGMEPGELWRWP